MIETLIKFEKELIRVGFSPKSAHNQRLLAQAFTRVGMPITEEAAEEYVSRKGINVRAAAEQIRNLQRFVKFMTGEKVTIKNSGKNGYSRPRNCWHNCIYAGALGKCMYKPDVCLSKQIVVKDCEFLTEPEPKPNRKRSRKMWDYIFGKEAVYMDSHSVRWG